MFTHEMRGKELAEYLSENLTDAEFELMLRFRCQKLAKQLVADNTEYNDTHTRFCFRWGPDRNDNGWTASIGVSYSKTDSSEGEVLSICIKNAVAALDARFANKISGLLGSDVKEPSTDEVPF